MSRIAIPISGQVLEHLRFAIAKDSIAGSLYGDLVVESK